MAATPVECILTAALHAASGRSLPCSEYWVQKRNVRMS